MLSWQPGSNKTSQLKHVSNRLRAISVQRSSLTRPDSGTQVVDNWKRKPIIIWQTEGKICNYVCKQCLRCIIRCEGKVKTYLLCNIHQMHICVYLWKLLWHPDGPIRRTRHLLWLRLVFLLGLQWNFGVCENVCVCVYVDSVNKQHVCSHFTQSCAISCSPNTPDAAVTLHYHQEQRKVFETGRLLDVIFFSRNHVSPPAVCLYQSSS